MTDREPVGQADVAAVLAEHTRLTYSDRPFTCSCEPHVSDGTRSYAQHLAFEAVLPLLAQAKAAGAAEVRGRVEDEADRWERFPGDLPAAAFVYATQIRQALDAPG